MDWLPREKNAAKFRLDSGPESLVSRFTIDIRPETALAGGELAAHHSLFPPTAVSGRLE